MSKKFETLLEATLVRYQRSQFLTGDLIKFKKGWQKHPWVQAHPEYAAKIQEFISSGNNLRLSATKSTPTGVMGQYGTYENEQSNWADITRESAPGLYQDFMTVPDSIIEVVDTNNNLAPVPDGMKRKDNTTLKPQNVKIAAGGEEFSPEKQTHHGEGDRQLLNKNVKLPHGNKWNDKKPGGGNTKNLKKVQESFGLPKDEATLIFEAMYKENHENEACPGCGCMPGDGVTETCNDPNGCGFWKQMETSQGPDQCYGCGKHKQPGEQWVVKKIDADPGDPEVGPQPQIIDVEYCPDCIKNNVKGPPSMSPD